MKDEEPDSELQSRLVDPEIQPHGQKENPVWSSRDGQNPLNETAPDKDRAALLHIGAAVTPLIEKAERQRLSRLCHFLRLVKAETEAQLEKRNKDTR